MIGIRADANSIIATGHVMRCISIAKAVQELGEKVTFFLADQESLSLFRANTSKDEFDVVVLGSDWQNMEGEIDVLKKELEVRNIDMLLVDSYSVTKAYFEALKSVCRVSYMDDLLKEEYPVNVVINYSGYSNSMGYDKAYENHSGFGNEKTRLCLGLKYAPLREQFYKLVSDEQIESTFTDASKRHVLISTGGADMCGMLIPILDMIESDDFSFKAVWHIVVGDFVDNKDEILGRAKFLSNVVIHKSVRNMACLMNKCDLAVMAAGTMLTECAACGLPTIFYQVADNQKYNVEYWGQVDGMSFAGDVSQSDDIKTSVIGEIKQKLTTYIGDDDGLVRMSSNLKQITDGKGAIRIAKVLIGEV